MIFFHQKSFKFSEIPKKFTSCAKKFVEVGVNFSHLFFKKWQIPKKHTKNFFFKNI